MKNEKWKNNKSEESKETIKIEKNSQKVQIKENDN